MTRTRSRVCLALAVLFALGLEGRPAAYLKLGVNVGTSRVSLKWQQVPARYFVTNRDVPGVSASQLQAAVGRAFGTWQASDAQVSATFVGYTGANPFEDDNMSVIGFLSRPEMERVLGATTFLIDTTNGQILESDIFLNASFAWSVAQGGEAGRYDVESIALHEIGHFFGLGHSALGETELRPTGGRRVIAAEAVMFPIAFAAGSIDGRTLKADDVAGISDLYPPSGFTSRTGSISGRVRKNGKGVYGAHIVAMALAGGALVANFTLDDEGSFVIAGLSPGPYVVRVEPLDDADLESFFDNPAKVDVNFKVTFFDRLAIAPRGGSGSSFDVTVAPK